ncbi:MAG TPA: Coq4 family protein [Pseudomonadales bacterium]|nr:Coq4 family protein [Pseudomonadales bacterium]
MATTTIAADTIAPTRDTRLQPLRALGALRTLVRDPADTEQVFHIMDALRGRTMQRNLEKLRRMRPDLLRRRDDVIALLSDREALAALPDGSLGRVYLAFCEREGITPEGLVEASTAAGRREADGTLSWFERRGRDTHDLWHVITGYGTQPLGEVCVVAFSFAQSGHLGFAAIALAGTLKHARHIGLHRSFAPTLEAVRNGRRAAWFYGQDWAALLAEPLDEVRELLGVRRPEAYEASVAHLEVIAA